MAHMIKFGDDFNEWPDSRKIDYLKKLASSMNEAADNMQKERNVLAEKVTELESLLLNSQRAYDIQRTIVASAITESNEHRESDAETIRVLKDRVKAQDIAIEAGRGD